MPGPFRYDRILHRSDSSDAEGKFSMMGRNGGGIPAAGLLVVVLCFIRAAVLAADAPRPGPPDDRMAAIVAAVRAEEARFQDLEYAARITIRDASRQGPAGRDGVTTLATRLVIFQGGRTYFRHRSFDRAFNAKFRREEVSAFDGDRTLAVVAGNCANIHPGRWDHPDLSAAHSLPLSHCAVDFPLSVFLAGTAAIHAHPRSTRDLAELGAPDAFVEVATRVESEEEVDGLRCLRLRVDRRFPGQVRALQYVWLAPGRNYHCIRERLSWPEERFSNLPAHEMHVEELRELAPGVWFPTKIAVVDYAGREPGGAPQSVIGRTATIVERVELAPRHEAAFFRDLAIPADLPVFTVKDREPVGWTPPPQPIGGDAGQARLAELVARVAAERRRYEALEVKAHESWKYVDPDALEQNRVTERSRTGRSVHRGNLAYSTGTAVLTFRNGGRTALSRTLAYDGQWTRVSYGQDARQLGVDLRRGRSATDPMLRESDCPHHPHLLLMRDYLGMVPTLEELLDPSAAPPSGRFACHLRPCGPAAVDGHPCVALRGELTLVSSGTSVGMIVLYLATDRNHIPIRLEYYLQSGGRYLLRQTVSAGDFREISPGLWYPFRVTGLEFETGLRRARGWVLLVSRHDMTIDSAITPPRVDEAVFRAVTAPAGAAVPVRDEDGRRIGEIRQAETGVPSLTTAEYLKLLSQVPAMGQEIQTIRKAVDALIGKPAPEFPPGATWMNGRPATWQELRGRIVILAFWAEWSEACRDDLARLARMHRERGENGPTIIGIHPPGSEPAAIKRVIETCRLGFATCVDVAPAEGTNAWGNVFGRFAVRAVPHGVVIDAEGKVVACDRLEDILERAGAMVKRVP
jgi:peroxiredoxin